MSVFIACYVYARVCLCVCRHEHVWRGSGTQQRQEKTLHKVHTTSHLLNTVKGHNEKETAVLQAGAHYDRRVRGTEKPSVSFS